MTLPSGPWIAGAAPLPGGGYLPHESGYIPTTPEDRAKSGAGQVGGAPGMAGAGGPNSPPSSGAAGGAGAKVQGAPPKPPVSGFSDLQFQADDINKRVLAYNASADAYVKDVQAFNARWIKSTSGQHFEGTDADFERYQDESRALRGKYIDVSMQEQEIKARSKTYEAVRAKELEKYVNIGNDELILKDDWSKLTGAQQAILKTQGFAALNSRIDAENKAAITQALQDSFERFKDDHGKVDLVAAVKAGLSQHTIAVAYGEDTAQQAVKGAGRPPMGGWGPRGPSLVKAVGVVTAETLFPPAKQWVEPELHYKATAMDWAIGGAQIALFALPLVGMAGRAGLAAAEAGAGAAEGSAAARAAALGAKAATGARLTSTTVQAGATMIFAKDTYDNWQTMTPLQRAFAVGMDALLAGSTIRSMPKVKLDSLLERTVAAGRGFEPPKAGPADSVNPGLARELFGEPRQLTEGGRIGPWESVGEKGMLRAVAEGRKPIAGISVLQGDPTGILKTARENGLRISYDGKIEIMPGDSFVADGESFTAKRATWVKNYTVYANTPESRLALRRVVEARAIDDSTWDGYIRKHAEIGRAYGYSDADVRAFMENAADLHTAHGDGALRAALSRISYALKNRSPEMLRDGGRRMQLLAERNPQSEVAEILKARGKAFAEHPNDFINLADAKARPDVAARLQGLREQQIARRIEALAERKQDKFYRTHSVPDYVFKRNPAQVRQYLEERFGREHVEQGLDLTEQEIAQITREIMGEEVGAAPKVDFESVNRILKETKSTERAASEVIKQLRAGETPKRLEAGEGPTQSQIDKAVDDALEANRRFIDNAEEQIGRHPEMKPETKRQIQETVREAKRQVRVAEREKTRTTPQTEVRTTEGPVRESEALTTREEATKALTRSEEKASVGEKRVPARELAERSVASVARKYGVSTRALTAALTRLTPATQQAIRIMSQPLQSPQAVPGQRAKTTLAQRPVVVPSAAPAMRSKSVPETKPVARTQPIQRTTPTTNVTPVPQVRPIPEVQPEHLPDLPTVTPLEENTTLKKKVPSETPPVKTWTQEDIANSTALKAGFGWYLIRPDGRIKFFRELPAGVQNVPGGRGSGYRSVQTVTGKPAMRDVRIGIVTAHIRLPSKQPGKIGAVVYSPDMRMRRPIRQLKPGGQKRRR